MRTAIVGGTIVSPSGSRRADVVCEDETIAAVCESVDGRRIVASADVVIDADGLLVFPGFIDPHVHSRDPGATLKEDFAHSTRAAAAGGVTTILEMPNAIPPVTDASVLRERARVHGRSAFVDFGLWGLSLGKTNLGEIEGLFAAGAIGVKLFLGYALDAETLQLVYNPEPGRAVVPPPGNADVLDVFFEIARVGGLLAAHCEDAAVLARASRDVADPVDPYEALVARRPSLAEAVAVATGIEFAAATGCQFHVVHVASGRAVELIRRARQEGIPISAETCPHYLTLTPTDFKELGATMKVYPPVRGPEDQAALWAGIADGTLGTVSSDHAPHTMEEKAAGFDAAPAGAIGVETLGPVMLDRMAEGGLSPERLSWILSEGAARLYGLFPRKGVIAPGADADLTLVDPQRSREVVNERLHTKQRDSPWRGRTLRASPVRALLRGRTIMEEGEPVGAPAGRFIARG